MPLRRKPWLDDNSFDLPTLESSHCAMVAPAGGRYRPSFKPRAQLPNREDCLEHQACAGTRKPVGSLPQRLAQIYFRAAS